MTYIFLHVLHKSKERSYWLHRYKRIHKYPNFPWTNCISLHLLSVFPPNNDVITDIIPSLSYIPVTYSSQLKSPLFIGSIRRCSSIKTSLQLHAGYILYAQKGTYPLLFRLWFSVFSSFIFPVIKVSFMIRDAIG